MPNSKESYHKHPHRDSSVETLIDFVTDGASIGHGIDIFELINFEDELGNKNIDKVLQLYSSREKSDYSETIAELTEKNVLAIGQLPLKIGTELILPLTKVDRELKKLDTNQVVDFRTFSQFMASQLYYLLKDPRYERTYKFKSATKAHSVREVFNSLSVWVWSRALSKNDECEYTDVLLDITPFVKNIKTSVGANGGNWSMDIAGVTTECNGSGWELDPNIKFTDSGFISSGGFYKQLSEELQRNDYFFHHTIQENDVIFIRYEKLDLETDRENPERTFQVPKSELAGKTYDMIGLVDSNTLSSSGENIDVSINVSGRDLSKLFIEDGVYFYPFDYIDDGIFANENDGDRLERYDGQLKSRFQLGFKTIDNTFKFVMNALSTIKITSDDLFESYANSQDIEDLEYKDRRSRKFYTSRKSLVEKQKQIEDRDINITEIKELLEQSIGVEKITNPPKTNSLYNQLLKFVKENKKKGNITEKENKLVGWGATTFGSAKIKADTLPAFFGNRLYKGKRAWRDGNGNVINDQERKDFLTGLEKKIARIKAKQKVIKGKVNDNLIIKELQIDSKEKVEEPEVDKYAGKALQDFLNDELNKNLESGTFQKSQVFETDAALATGGNLASDLQIKQKIRHDELTAELADFQDEIAALRKRGKSIRAIELPKKFQDLNEFGQQAMQRMYSHLKQIETANESVVKDELKLTKGIWQIIKLLVDDNVRNRRVVDSSIGNEQGSLMNALRKIAQEPFVEMMFDTYGDQYYISIRKPPFDKKGMTSMLADQDVLVEQTTAYEAVGSPSGEGETTQTETPVGEEEAAVIEERSLVMEIDDSDVISDSLSYGLTNQIYSWYRLTPQNLIAGQADSMAFAYLKAIYFKEYADIWGSKPLDLTTNYVPYFPVVDKNAKLPTGYFIKQGILDLKFMIESNAYNPFIRSGSITVIGNRLFKRGTFVRLKSTREIFYVESVSNSSAISGDSVSRTTTLELSRGMVEDFIEGVELNGVNHSYFNIVNTEIDDDKFLQAEQGYSDANKMLADWKVNPEVFCFFLKKKQFCSVPGLKAANPAPPRRPWGGAQPKFF